MANVLGLILFYDFHNLLMKSKGPNSMENLGLVGTLHTMFFRLPAFLSFSTLDFTFVGGQSL